jgi:hypothetical protein
MLLPVLFEKFIFSGYRAFSRLALIVRRSLCATAFIATQMALKAVADGRSMTGIVAVINEDFTLI